MEHSGRLAVRSAFDYAAEGSDGVAGNATPFERRATHRVDVAAGSRKHNGPVGHRAIEIGPVRETAFRQIRFIEASSEQPGTGGERRGGMPDHGLEFAKTTHVAQVDHGREQMADFPDVCVGVDEPRYHRRPT